MRARRSGFLLAELLFAIVVLLLTALWVLAAYHAALDLTEVSQQTSVALDDLKDMMERIKATPFSQLTANFPHAAVNGIVGGGPDTYQAIIGGVYGLVNEQITVLHQPSIAADPRELVVQITWTTRGRTYQKSVSTMRASEAS